MKDEYESMIVGLKAELENVHNIQNDYKKYNDFILTTNKAAIHSLQDQVETYRKQQRAIKAILRIPRLCTMYQGQMARLSETDQNKLLETLYNNYFLEKRDQEVQDETEALENM